MSCQCHHCNCKPRRGCFSLIDDLLFWLLKSVLLVFGLGIVFGAIGTILFSMGFTFDRWSAFLFIGIGLLILLLNAKIETWFNRFKAWPDAPFNVIMISVLMLLYLLTNC